jgi:hypothetical protein
MIADWPVRRYTFTVDRRSTFIAEFIHVIPSSPRPSPSPPGRSAFPQRGDLLMAARNGSTAGCGCMVFGLLVLIGWCGSLGESDSSSGPSSSYSSEYTPRTPAAPSDHTPREWFYVHGPLNVRSEPNKDGSVVRTLRRGDYVQLGPKDARGWARLYSPGSAEGYVYRASDLVQRNMPSAPRALASTPSRSSGGGSRRSSAESRGYYTGPRGGCYTYSASGRKRYVDRSYCN